MELYDHILLQQKICLKTEKLSLAEFQWIIRLSIKLAEFDELPENTTFEYSLSAGEESEQLQKDPLLCRSLRH
jgi:hypothetical protein